MISLTPRRLRLLSLVPESQAVDRKYLYDVLYENAKEGAYGLGSGDQKSLDGLAEMGLLSILQDEYRTNLHRYMYQRTEKGTQLLALLDVPIS